MLKLMGMLGRANSHFVARRCRSWCITAVGALAWLLGVLAVRAYKASPECQDAAPATGSR